MTGHRSPSDATADEPPNVHPAALVAIAAMWLLVYIPLTWSTQRDTWSWLRGQSFALHPTLVVMAWAALWTAPVVALAGTLRLVRRPHAVGQPRLVLAYLQTLTIVLVVVVETAVARFLLADGAASSLGHERWLGLTLVASSAAICAGTTRLARIAHTSPRFTSRNRMSDVRIARRCSLAAGACALVAAPLTYVGRTSTPTVGAVVLYGGTTVTWIIATHPLFHSPEHLHPNERGSP